MAMIPKNYFNAVVAIGSKSGTTTQWFGTGFIVGKNAGGSKYRIFLVTCGHVLDGQSEVILRFNNDKTGGIDDVSLHLYDDKDKPLFSFHDGYTYTDKKIDIAAIQINPNYLKKHDITYGFFALDKNALTLKQMRDTGVEEGTLVYSLGFPLRLVCNSKTMPICRMGCIARATKEQVEEKIVYFWICKISPEDQVVQ